MYLCLCSNIILCVVLGTWFYGMFVVALLVLGSVG
jgi:hypothetical protein